MFFIFCVLSNKLLVSVIAWGAIFEKKSCVVFYSPLLLITENGILSTLRKKTRKKTTQFLYIYILIYYIDYIIQ